MIQKFSKSAHRLFQTSFYFSQKNEPPNSFNPFDVYDIGEAKKPKGSLIIIPTPIGNLRDLSIRQYETLLNVDIIACEDTRITGNLLNLIKKKKIKEQMEADFGVNLKDLSEETQYDDGDIIMRGEKLDRLKILKEEDKLMKELVTNISPGTEVQDYETRKKLREELRIKALKSKAKRILEGVDTLNFLSKIDSSANQDTEEEIYGIEDDFLVFMKKKIAEAKAKKGRGLLLSYHKYNESARINRLIKVMKYGFKVGLVSDAGTPTISDPGYKLVEAVIKEGMIIEALPGPNSVSVALSLSGFPSDRFCFEGYLSKTQDLKLNKLLKVREAMMTAVFFESSQRLEKSLISIEKVFGKSQMIFIAFEMTKLHQTIHRKTIREIINMCNNKEIIIKGEITLIIAPYIKTYNSDIVDKNATNQEEDIEIALQKKKNEEKKEKNEEQEDNELKINEKEKIHIHQVDENHLMEVLDEKFDITDKQMAEVIEEILHLTKTRSMHIVRKFRFDRSPRTGKIFDAEDFKF